MRLSETFRIVGRTLLCTALVAPCAFAEDAGGPGPASINPLRALGKSTFKGFVEQPLFDPTRRLPPPPPVAVALPPPPPPPPPPEAPPPVLHLLGIIQGKRDVAVVHRDEDPTTILLYSGDKVDDWTATVEATGELTLRNGERVANFKLFNPSAPGTVAPNPEDADLNAAAQAVAPRVDARNSRLLKRRMH